MLKEVIRLTGELYCNLSALRKQIKDKGVLGVNVFKCIDVGNKGYLSVEDIQNLLDEKNVKYENKSLKYVMKLFRKKLNERIGVEEFEGFVDW
jgi:Ca2+-binding EF-hand superfamily protein